MWADVGAIDSASHVLEINCCATGCTGTSPQHQYKSSILVRYRHIWFYGLYLFYNDADFYLYLLNPFKINYCDWISQIHWMKETRHTKIYSAWFQLHSIQKLAE